MKEPDPKLVEERKKLLTPEQREIAERWVSDQAASAELLGEAIKAVEAQNIPEMLRLLDEAGKVSPSRCPHDRAIWGTCGACEDVERILFPELYEEEDG